jgi:hypothetical protein
MTRRAHLAPSGAKNWPVLERPNTARKGRRRMRLLRE